MSEYSFVNKKAVSRLCSRPTVQMPTGELDALLKVERERPTVKFPAVRVEEGK